MTLGPFKSKDGAFSESVFRHKESKTLIVTDTVLEVTDEVPEILALDPSPLLYHARDTITQIIDDTPENRKIGWRRVALFGLYFTPSAIDIKDGDVAFKERRPDINSDFIGIYPWCVYVCANFPLNFWEKFLSDTIIGMLHIAVGPRKKKKK